MNFLLMLPKETIISCVLFLAFLYNLWRKKYSHHSKNKKNPPPQPLGAWPIIGNIHLLYTQNHIAHTLSILADKHGPIFTLRLGMKRAVIISSHETVKECFTTDNKFFVNRPKTSAGEHLVYNHVECGFTYSPYWHEIRKLISLEMEKINVSEIKKSIGKLFHETKGIRPCKVIMNDWIEEMVLNIIVKGIFGKTYKGGNFREIFRDVVKLSGELVLSDVILFPFLKWMDLQGHIKSMKSLSKELDIVLEKCIDERLMRRSMRGEVVEEEDFIEVVLASIDDKFATNGPPRLTIIKTIVVNVILGGFHTTSVFLIKLLIVLVKYNEVLKQAQDEIDAKIGKETWVQESDLNNLPYLNAIIKETLRLYPPLPLSIPHEAVQNCYLDGYLISKGTHLFVNLWKLHRDPRVWKEPEKFRPERFLTGQKIEFEFIPFGYGKRMCPGIGFAMRMIGFTIARLIQGFEFNMINGWIGSDLETREKENSLELLVKSRLASHLYEQY